MKEDIRVFRLLHQGNVLKCDTERNYPAIDRNHLIVFPLAIHIPFEFSAFTQLLLHKSEIFVVHYFREISSHHLLRLIS